jgi:hypothetical protein
MINILNKQKKHLVIDVFFNLRYVFSYYVTICYSVIYKYFYELIGDFGFKVSYFQDKALN